MLAQSPSAGAQLGLQAPSALRAQSPTAPQPQSPSILRRAPAPGFGSEGEGAQRQETPNSDMLAEVATFSVHELLSLVGKAHDRDIAKARAEKAAMVKWVDDQSDAGKNDEKKSPRQLTFRAPEHAKNATAPLPPKKPPALQLDLAVEEDGFIHASEGSSIVNADPVVEEVEDFSDGEKDADPAPPSDENGLSPRNRPRSVEDEETDTAVCELEEIKADNQQLASPTISGLCLSERNGSELAPGKFLSQEGSTNGDQPRGLCIAEKNGSGLAPGKFHSQEGCTNGDEPKGLCLAEKNGSGLAPGKFHSQEGSTNGDDPRRSVNLERSGSLMIPDSGFQSERKSSLVSRNGDEPRRSNNRICFSAEDDETIPSPRGIASVANGAGGRRDSLATVLTLNRSNTAGRKSLIRGFSSAALKGGEDEIKRERMVLTVYKEWNRDLMQENTDALIALLNNESPRRRSSLGHAFHEAQLRREKTKMGLHTIDNVHHLYPEINGAPSSMNRFVIAPNALRRIWWNSFGLVCIIFDLITIPLQVFSFENGTVLNVIGVSFSIFWTADLCMNFFTGYYCKSGIIEMRLQSIARNYLRGWFLPDLILASIDWLVFCAEVAADNVGILRIGKSVRLGKSLRLLRLARLAKMDGMYADIMKQINSEEFSTLAALVVRMGNILICSHWIACGWYGQTLIGGETWVKYHMESLLDVDDEAALQYTTSLHWTLTQFTPASMEVYPHNLRERIINIGVLLFGLITFTSLISRISNAMSHLQGLNSAHFLTRHKLRQWLRENKVSMNLVARVWACIKESSKQNRRTPQKDVIVLQQLPKSIMAELYHEIYEPIIQTHPFLGAYVEFNPTGLRQLCSAAVSEIYLFPGDELFTPGEKAQRAFFLCRGTVLYDTDPSKMAHALSLHVHKAREDAAMPRCHSKIMDSIQKQKPVIEAGMWVSEVALWVEWVYRSPAVAAEYCELVGIAGETFRDILKALVHHDHMLGKYASLFAQRAVHELDHLDIWFESDVLEDLAWCAFYEGADLSIRVPLSTERLLSTYGSESTTSETYCANERLSVQSAMDNLDEEETVRIPLAALTEAEVAEVEEELERWHHRVRQMRSDQEEESEIERQTGWLWSNIMPKLRDSLGRNSGERRSGGGSISLGDTRSIKSVKSTHSLFSSFRRRSSVKAGTLPGNRCSALSTHTRDSWASPPSSGAPFAFRAGQ